MTSNSFLAAASTNSRTIGLWCYLSCMFSMALGWRIRGQFGHEVGASMAGAMGAMSIVLFSKREDWLRRISEFAVLGALGWAFGGSISYMKVVGYTHSSDSATVIYGFCGMLLIGFMWSFLGAAGSALPAVLDHVRLTSVFTAITVVFVAWFISDVANDLIGKLPTNGSELGVKVPEMSGLVKHDLDWWDTTVAIIAVLGASAIRRRIDFGSSLVLHLAIGWWIAVAVLVLLLGLRLNPPRGDNWAGCVGLVAGMLVFGLRHRLTNLLYVATVAGLLGTAGFCIGQALKLTFLYWEVKGDWHAVMEAIHGAFFGLGLAVGMRSLLGASGEPLRIAMPRWIPTWGILFVLGVIPYLNIRRSPEIWLKNVEKLSPAPFGVQLVAGLIPSRGFVGWFDALWLLAGLLLVLLIRRHFRRPVRVVPESSIGKGQLLFLLFIWIVTFMSFVHEVPKYTPHSLVIQCWITINALICTAIVLAGPADPIPISDPSADSVPQRPSRVLLVVSLLAALASVFAGYQTKRILYLDAFARGFYMDHIRFGPNNTNDTR